MTEDTVSSDSKTVAFTGGGTGGHIYPGLAVIQSLRSRGFSGRIVWLGSTKESDRYAVEDAKVEYLSIPSGKLRRSFSLENLIDFTRVAAAYFSARKLLKAVSPSLLFSKGGYVSVPPCWAAKTLGIPFFTHESDASPGLATRLNAKGAEKIFTSWPGTKDMLPHALRSKVVVTGNPVRPTLFSGSEQRGRQFLAAPLGMPIVTFLGGSQGSRQINSIVQDILPSLQGKAFVVHQTGKDLFDKRIHNPQAGMYAPLPYIGREISDILAATTVAVGRAGAGTVWECASLGIPMVLIPLSGKGTRGDQVENAAMASSVGAAACLTGEDSTPGKVLKAIQRFLDSPFEYSKAQSACKRLTTIESNGEIPLHSADFIANLILARLAEESGGKL